MTAIIRPIRRIVRRLRSVPVHWRSTVEHASVLAENVFTRNNGALVIIDDFFPSLATAFRIAEFNTILGQFERAIVYSTSSNKEMFSQYATHYPQLASRVRKFHPLRRLGGSVAYLVFLNNIYNYVNLLEEAQVPFAFELYPGGGFCLDESASDAHLQRVFNSPMFRKVIVTQSITQDYLLRKRFCCAEQIEFIFGVVVLSDTLSDLPHRRLRFGLDKPTLDICFVANKYKPRGADKGYDRFIESARILSRHHTEARFHVVGDFTPDDIEVSDLGNRITFYGHQLTSFFPGFYSRMDIILSPNLPFVFGPGAFDGFPTGCCVEAALCGTALFISDELKLNGGRLKEGKEAVIISCDPNQIAEAVGHYIADPDRLALLAKNGQNSVKNLFAMDSQMKPRLRVLSDLLALR